MYNPLISTAHLITINLFCMLLHILICEFLERYNDAKNICSFMKLHKIAWGITGAGHFLNESYEIFKDIKLNNRDVRINTFVSSAANVWA